MIKKLRTLTLLAILCFSYIILYTIYSPRVNAFGCFDDCFNYVAGYFLLKGKSLYSEIFFNHQMLAAYISYLIQLFSQPSNIYELVLRHRQFVFLFSFLINALIVWRFNLAGLGFVLFYEFSKFYVFGDRFLAEALIVYPLVYMTGLIWFKFNKRKIYSFEYILSGVFTWFVVFMREPFIPLALLIYFLIVWEKPLRTKMKKISLSVFATLTFLALAFTPLPEYIFNVVTINLKTRPFPFAMMKTFFYPIYLFFGGEWNIFRHFILSLDSLFLILLLLLLLFYKRIKLIGIIILLLGFANFRVVNPGRIFYEAFHMLPWYGMFILILFLMLSEVYKYKRKIGLLFSTLLVFLFAYIIFSPQSFIHDEVNPHEEFITNFGNELQVGEVVKSLSDPGDTLFLDGFDDLIYWQADRLSTYKYSWYTSVMPRIPKYSQARLDMFADDPPDFYYGTCPGKEVPSWMMPENIRDEYQQLYSSGKPTCLYVRKAKIPQISKERWEKARESLYELPMSL